MGVPLVWTIVWVHIRVPSFWGNYHLIQRSDQPLQDVEVGDHCNSSFGETTVGSGSVQGLEINWFRIGMQFRSATSYSCRGLSMRRLQKSVPLSPELTQKVNLLTVSGLELTGDDVQQGCINCRTEPPKQWMDIGFRV